MDKEKAFNICFITAVVIIALLVVKMLWGQEIDIKNVPIRQRIVGRITEEIGTNTAIRIMLEEKTETDTSIREKKKKIIREEIENDVVKILIVKIPIEDIPALKIRYIDADTIEIDVSTLNIVQIKRIIFYLKQVSSNISVQYRDGKITVVEKKVDRVFWKWIK